LSIADETLARGDQELSFGFGERRPRDVQILDEFEATASSGSFGDVARDRYRRAAKLRL
jgi:hypothetical protein